MEQAPEDLRLETVLILNTQDLSESLFTKLHFYHMQIVYQSLLVLLILLFISTPLVASNLPSSVMCFIGFVILPALVYREFLPGDYHYDCPGLCFLFSSLSVCSFVFAIC